MQFFLPSVLVLLAAAAVVFFVLPKWGPFALALISAILLALGVYNHISTFGAEYRLATWHLGLISYAPYVMVGGLLFAIALYLFFLLPTSITGSANNTSTASILPTVAEMPTANTATNTVTGAINRALNTAANVISLNKKNNGGILNSVLGNAKKNNRGLNFPFSQV